MTFPLVTLKITKVNIKLFYSVLQYCCYFQEQREYYPFRVTISFFLEHSLHLH
jgi:hypothetical protein